MKAARLSPRSEPTKSHDFRPRAMPRRVRSAAFVCQADPAVVDEAGEGSPPICLEHVGDRRGDGIVLRHRAAFGEHPDVEIVDQRSNQAQPGSEPRRSVQPVDAALHIEDRIDPRHGFQSDGRDVVSGFALADITSDVGKFEELAAGMAPAERAADGTGIAIAAKEIIVAPVGVSLENTLPSGKVPVGVLDQIATTAAKAQDLARMGSRPSPSSTCSARAPLGHAAHNLSGNGSYRVACPSPRRQSTRAPPPETRS